jgi:hypothetical protein
MKFFLLYTVGTGPYFLIILAQSLDKKDQPVQFKVLSTFRHKEAKKG